jgi:uncharacterized protein involved in exopolysaccharide biosynthesis
MENPQQPIQEDEIDLREYIQVMLKRKKLILAIFLASVFTAAVISLQSPKTYEISSTIQLGRINELLINNEEAKALMLNQGLFQSIINDLNLASTPQEIEKNIKISDIKGTNLLRVKITGNDIDTAIKINDLITNSLITCGQALYQKNVDIINERLNNLSLEIKSAVDDIGRAQALIAEAPVVKNISQSDVSLRIILLRNSLLNYESNLNVLRNQENEMKATLVNSREFKVFDPPIRPDSPVSRKILQKTAIAGFMGLMLGIFLAFFIEFLSKDKK